MLTLPYLAFAEPEVTLMDVHPASLALLATYIAGTCTMCALIGLGIMNSDGLAALAGLAVAGAAGWIGFATLDSFPI